MTTITLESDSSHSPPGSNNSNERSSALDGKKAQNTGQITDSCAISRKPLVDNFPEAVAGFWTVNPRRVRA